MLTGAKQKALQHKATIDWTSFEGEIEDYLATASPQMWRKVFTPLIRGIMIDQGERWANVLGVTFDVQNLGARDWFNKYMLKFAQEIGQTTKEYVLNVLDLGMTEGWSIPMMQDRITEVFGHMATNDPANLEWYLDRMPAYRSEMIARTETIRASNAGTTELFSEWGVKRHEWLSTPDDRTRGPDSEQSPSEFDHIGSNGEVVEIGEPFTRTGEALMFPGDPAGSPGNTINCRCTTIPIVEGMEGDKSLKYSDDQPRDENGRWTDGGGESSGENRYSRQVPNDINSLSERYTDQEKEALHKYSSGAYRDLNARLRDGKELSEEQKELQSLLDSAIDKSGEFEEVTVLRGVRYGRNILNKDDGEIIRLPSYQSTSFYTEPAIDASSGKDFFGKPTGIIYEITTNKGAYISQTNSQFDDEAELLLGRDWSYEITGKEYNAKFEVGDYGDIVTRDVVKLRLIK